MESQLSKIDLTQAVEIARLDPSTDRKIIFCYSCYLRPLRYDARFASQKEQLVTAKLPYEPK